MFGFFNRTKIKQWEIDLLEKVFESLNQNYSSFKSQVKEGLLTGVRLYPEDKSNYVGFKYNPGIAEKYLDDTARDYAIKGVQVFDKKQSKYIDFIIHVTHGLICGYSTPESDTPKFDIGKLKVPEVKNVYEENPDFEQIKNLLSGSEHNLLNPSEVYKVELEGKIYYHLKDLEDGDFIGIDDKKRVYQFTHDPYEIKFLSVDLESVLSNN
ncbi:MAG: hypothetical protein AAF731_09375 [Bacteroidota bacterium]